MKQRRVCKYFLNKSRSACLTEHMNSKLYGTAAGIKPNSDLSSLEIQLANTGIKALIAQALLLTYPSTVY